MKKFSFRNVSSFTKRLPPAIQGAITGLIFAASFAIFLPPVGALFRWWWRLWGF